MVRNVHHNLPVRQTNSGKPKDVQCTVIQDKEKDQILTV